MMDSVINNVPDTALLIAAYRAQESEREDAAFRDPFAKELAGERGYQMAAAIPHSKAVAFAMVMRTLAIDQLIFSAISKEVDTVINLGAGMDTRPYRLLLPSNLSWIEVDFEHVLSYKNKILSKEHPICKLQSISADLTSNADRKNLFKNLSDQASKALIITEGLIGYMTNAQATELSRDLFLAPAFQYWIMDYAQGKMRKTRQSRDIKRKLKNAPIQFRSADPLGFFGKQGWTVCENRFILDEADKIGRPLPVMFPWTLLMKIFYRRIREIGNKTYGYVLMSK